MLGIVCDHRICHSAIMMTKGENWRFATMALQSLIQQGCVPASVPYDINCRYEKYFQAWVQQTASLSVNQKAAAQQTLMPVPPFHANMHNAECRKQFALSSGRYPGWAMPQGEPTEQMWSAMGPCTRIKYMTLHGGKLLLDCMLIALNSDHGKLLAPLLVKRVKLLLRQQAAAQEHLALLQEYCKTSVRAFYAFILSQLSLPLLGILACGYSDAPSALPALPAVPTSAFASCRRLRLQKRTSAWR